MYVKTDERPVGEPDRLSDREHDVETCPKGYDECSYGCAYPGRCGRFESLDDASKLLLKAAALMEERGIAKGVTIDAEGKLCLLGALLMANSNDMCLDDFHGPSTLKKSWTRLCVAVGMRDACHWNNAPERTCDEAVAKLRAVALGG